MSTEASNPRSVAGGARAAREQRWQDVAIPAVEHEDRLAPEEAQEVWAKVYELFAASGEGARREARLAVYAYYGVNGSSPATKHSRDVTTGGGQTVAAADVGYAIGVSRIRQFLRSDVDDAYAALKGTGVLEHDSVYVSKMADRGIPRGYMHSTVDYLKGCSLMTPEESGYADICFQYAIRRAAGARGGKTIRELEEDGRSRRLSRTREASRVDSAADDL